jgi:outer membrane receptor protein involved in Fe transport
VARPSPLPARLSFLPWLLAVGFAAPAWAQNVADARSAALGEVVVSGSRTEQKKDDLAASVEVIDREAIEAQQIHDIRDAVRDLPNVSVKRAPARFGLASGNTGRDGNAGFNIRGLASVEAFDREGGLMAMFFGAQAGNTGARGLARHRAPAAAAGGGRMSRLKTIETAQRFMP